MSEKYTLVQHSGYNAGGNPQFSMSVEAVSVSTREEERAVKRAGGVLFDSFDEASDQEERENYPPEVAWLIPYVRGSFSKVRHDGSPIYLPDPVDGLVKSKKEVKP
jgi:hypothetical protein